MMNILGTIAMPPSATWCPPLSDLATLWLIRIACVAVVLAVSGTVF
jgi:hypothetical protein